VRALTAPEALEAPKMPAVRCGPAAEKLPTIAAERPADSGWSSLRSGGSGSEEFNLESQLTQEATLAEHLTNQLNLAIADPARRLIGAHLIGLVDEAGYLTGDLESAAETLGTSVAEVEKVLASCRASIPPACSPGR
jgi:RNA polymerase sigma-54 factor